MSDPQNDASTSGASSRSFLQQTTSQLLHQQEALRRRREVLERESRKPPAMRFGLNSPTRSRSPVPRTHGHTPAPPASEQRNRTCSRDAFKEATAAPLVNQPPMRFSLSYRPTPTPSAALNASLRTVSISPTPLEVNKISSRGRSRSETRKRARVSRSHTPSEADDMHVVETDERKENACDDAVERSFPRHVPPHEEAGEMATATSARAAFEEEQNTPLARMDAREEERGSEKEPAPTASAAPVPAALETEEAPAVTGRTCVPVHGRPSSEFALPQYSPSPAVRARLSTTVAVASGAAGQASLLPDLPRPQSDQSKASEFPSPIPTRASHATLHGLPAPPPPRDVPASVTNGETAPLSPVRRATVLPTPSRQALLQTGADGSPTATGTALSLAFSHEKQGGAPELGDADRDDDMSSPAPTAADVITSFDASCEKRCCARPSPVRGAGQGDNAAQEAKTPRDRWANSPVPTAKNLIESVMAVASSDKRPCGCDRPTPSPHPHRTSRTASPPPTPVQLLGELNRSSGNARHVAPARVDGRPTPASLSASASESTNAAQVPKVAKVASPSPWPTTAHIVQSIEVSADVYKSWHKAAEEDSEASRQQPLPEEKGSEGGSEEGRMEDDEGPLSRAPRTPSPGLTPQHIIDSIHASGEKPTCKEEAMSRSHTGGTAATAWSPELTEHEIAASVLASLEKRRCGRPTPTTTDPESHSRTLEEALMGDSASPIPTTEQLLDSLEVTGERFKRGRSVEPAMQRGSTQTSEAGGKSRTGAASMRGTPSPVPTQDRIDSSVLASADKRRQHVSDTVSDSPPPAPLPPHVRGVQSLAPPPAFPDGDNDVLAEEEPAGSPVLASQHISESVKKFTGGQTAQAARSGAPEPKHPSHSTLREPLDGVTDGDGSTCDNTSPEVTEENIQDSVGILREDAGKAQKRSAAVAPARKGALSQSPLPSRQSDAAPHPQGGGNEPEEATDNGFSNANSAGDDEERGAKQSTDDTALTDDVQVSNITPVLPDSPSASDVCMDSAMFKDCASAGPTPAIPHLPPQFLALQQEVQAISEGRSRASGSLTPPPAPRPSRFSTSRLRATPPPTTAAPADAERKATTRSSTEFMAAAAAIAEHTMKQALSHAAGHQPPTEPATLDKTRRSSMVLVSESSSPAFPTLIQQPHHPMPEAAEKTPPPVSIPRTPTPPPRPLQHETNELLPQAEVVNDTVVDKQVQTGPPVIDAERQQPSRTDRSSGGGMLPDSHYEPSLSPLPRPVTLSSQVRLKSSFSQHAVGSRTPPPTAGPVVPCHSLPPTPAAVDAAESESAASTVIDGPTPVRAVSMRSAQCNTQSPREAYSLTHRLAIPVSTSPREGRSTPYPRGSTLLSVGEPDDDTRLPLQTEDARDYEEEETRARADKYVGRTVTVSPQGSAVVFTSHRPHNAPRGALKRPRGQEAADRGDVCVDATPDPRPPLRVKRSRVSSGMRDAPGAPAREAPSAATIATPHSADSPGSGDGGPHRPSPRPSGGRRSTAEQLLEMLPRDTQEALAESLSQQPAEGNGAANKDGSEDGSPTRGFTTVGTIDSQLSERSPATAGSSIVERVSQRERKQYYDYDYYLAYLNEMGRSSAKKARKTSAKEMQQSIMKDVQEGGGSSSRVTAPQQDQSTHQPASAARQASEKGSRESRAPRRLSTARSQSSPSQRVSAADVEVSPLTPSSASPSQLAHPRPHTAPGGGTPTELSTGRRSASGRKLSVTTRLSAELRDALFAHSESPKQQSGEMLPADAGSRAEEVGSSKRVKKMKAAEKRLKKTAAKNSRKETKPVKRKKGVKSNSSALAAPARSAAAGAEEPSPLPRTASPVKGSPAQASATAPQGELSRKAKRKLKKRARKSSAQASAAAGPVASAPSSSAGVGAEKAVKLKKSAKKGSKKSKK